MLLSPDQAERVVLAHTPVLPSEDCPLSYAHGRALRLAVKTDRDQPPFDRVTMDGYAVRASALAAGQREFRILGTQAAGMIPLELTADDTCVEVMTGAALPKSADAVIPYEDTSNAAGVVTVDAPPSGDPGDANVPGTPGQNVHRRGSDHLAGDTVIPPGTRLTGRDIAVAASCGRATLTVGMRPTVAVVATGDELVEADNPSPAPHQIRRSNDYALRATLLASGLVARADRFHLRDLHHEIENRLRNLLAEYDVLILTGGVSKGRFDHLPAVLAALHVDKKFHGVAQRPGKPFWFGLSPRKLPVFALPGNPVSACTCLQRYVLPSLAKMTGAAPAKPDYVALAEPVTFKPPLAWLLPVVVNVAADAARTASPAPFNTSGDFAGLVGTDGFVELPPGPATFPTGTVARFWAWT